MFFWMRKPLMQQEGAAGGGQGAAGTGAAAGSQGAGGAGAGAQGQGQAGAGQQAQGQQGAGSSQASTQQQAGQTQQPPDQAKGAGAEKAKTGDQAQIVIKPLDGTKANPKFVEAFTTQAKKLGLSQETAQGVYDFLTQAQTEGAKEFQGALEKQTAKEVEALKADKEFGGEKYEKTLAAKDSAVKQFFGEDLAKRAKEDGVISATDPDFVKGLARIRALVSEDTVGDKGGRPPPAANTREAQLQKMFPNSPGMFKQAR